MGNSISNSVVEEFKPVCHLFIMSEGDESESDQGHGSEDNGIEMASKDSKQSDVKNDEESASVAVPQINKVLAAPSKIEPVKSSKQGKHGDRRNSDDSKTKKEKKSKKHGDRKNSDDSKVKSEVSADIKPINHNSAIAARGLLPSIIAVKDHLKLREQTQFTVLTIEVSKLISAHRFTKNCPWLKSFYGTNYTWVAEYTENTTGTVHHITISSNFHTLIKFLSIS